MSHKKAFLLALLIIVLGLVFGWFLYAWINPALASPVSLNDDPSVARPLSKAGFCCITPGTECTEASDPDYCFRSAGISFNTSQKNCNYYCQNVKR